MKYIFDIPDNVDYGVLTCRTSNGYYEYDFDSSDLKQLPPAQPERIKGHWIKDANKWMCDKCGELVMDDDHNFCPNCGAKMEVTS